MRAFTSALGIAVFVAVGLTGVSAQQGPQIVWSPKATKPDKGHFHTESSEFWFILLGQIRYNIEGLPVFVADQGDIVYVPKQRWHLASFAGDGPSARLAMNGYPDLAHSFDAENAGR